MEKKHKKMRKKFSKIKKKTSLFILENIEENFLQDSSIFLGHKFLLGFDYFLPFYKRWLEILPLEKKNPNKINYFLHFSLEIFWGESFFKNIVFGKSTQSIQIIVFLPKEKTISLLPDSGTTVFSHFFW